MSVISGMIAGRVVKTTVNEVLSRIALNPRLSLEPKDVAAVTDLVTIKVEKEIAARDMHVRNSEPIYQSRVSQGSLLIVMTAVTDIIGLWQDGIENTPMDYGIPAVAIVGVAWVLYGRFIATKPFGA